MRHAVAAGARTLADIGERCGAGSQCGGCAALLESILAETTVQLRSASAA